MVEPVNDKNTSIESVLEPEIERKVFVIYAVEADAKNFKDQFPVLPDSCVITKNIIEIIFKTKKDAKNFVDNYRETIPQVTIRHSQEYYSSKDHIYSKERLEELEILFKSHFRIPEEIPKEFINEGMTNYFDELNQTMTNQFKTAYEELANVIENKDKIDNKVKQFQEIVSHFEKKFDEDWKKAIEQNKKEEADY